MNNEMYENEIKKLLFTLQNKKVMHKNLNEGIIQTINEDYIKIQFQNKEGTFVNGSSFFTYFILDKDYPELYASYLKLKEKNNIFKEMKNREEELECKKRLEAIHMQYLASKCKTKKQVKRKITK